MPLLSLDIGTTGCKAIVVSEQGEIVGRGYRRYPLQVSRPGWAEVDANEVWHAAMVAAREAQQNLNAEIEAVAVTSAGEVMVPVDRSGTPLSAAIVSLDQRATDQFHRLVDKVGAERLQRLAGFAPQPHHTIARWLWLRDTQPEIYREARWLLGWMEFIFLRLGVAPTTDRSLAVRSLAFNLASAKWDETLLEDVGLEGSKLPEVVVAGTQVGCTAGAGCEELGVPRGIPVVAGGLDQLCAAHGVGVAAGRTAMLGIGTTAVIGICSAPPSVPLPASLPRVPGPTAGTSLVLASTPAAGLLLRWFVEEFQAVQAETESPAEDSAVYEALVSGTRDIRTPILALPHLGGSRFAFDDPGATGALVGLRVGTRRTEIVRALLDGVAYEIWKMQLRLVESGLSSQSLIATGGGSRSADWMQIIADAVQMTVHSTASDHAAAYGAARFSSVGGNLGYRLAPLAVRETFTPRDDWATYHKERQQRFVATYDALHGLEEPSHD